MTSPTPTSASPHLAFAAQFFLWFGAAVSVAEILTGGFLAPLGWTGGMAANLVGHLLGTSLLALAGLAAYRRACPAVAAMRASLGRTGSYAVSCINVVQLIGWTAVMLIEGGKSLGLVAAPVLGSLPPLAPILLLGALVALWAVWGLPAMRTVNTLAAVLLLGLCAFLSVKLLGLPPATPAPGAPAPAPLTFGGGVELVAIMPLSWFPLIGDYSSRSTSGRSAFLAPFLGYLLGSTWMYGLGLGGALFSGSPEPADMLLAAGMGFTGLVVVVLSTVTTTFMDVYSASASTANVFPRLPMAWANLAFALVGTLLACLVPMEWYLDFLYLLGSFFAPLVAVVLTDAYLVRHDAASRGLDLPAFVSWAVGFVFYRLIHTANVPLGPTLATVAATAVVHLLVRRLSRPRTALTTQGA